MSDGLPPGISEAINVVLLSSDTFIFPSQPGVQQWGIFRDGFPVVVADSVLALDYRKDSTILSYPVENGGFESYNKVQNSYQAVVRFSTGGTKEDRQNLLDSIRAISDDLNLYDVVSPEVTYSNANVIMQDYRRSETSGYIQIDVRVEEVRIGTTANFTSTKTPSGMSGINSGNVQTSSFDEAGFTLGNVT